MELPVVGRPQASLSSAALAEAVLRADEVVGMYACLLCSPLQLLRG